MIYSVNEGKQAEEYKQKKEYEKYKNQQPDKRYATNSGHRNNIKTMDHQTVNNNPRFRQNENDSERKAAIKKDIDINRAATRMAMNKTDNLRSDKYSYEDYEKMHDAARRHLRRHNESTIFESVVFIDETTNKSQTSHSISAYYNEGIFIKNCEFAITDELVLECNNNPDLIAKAAILEGAKLDLKFKNWMKEGEDYKGLKKELNKIIEANNLSDDKLKSKGKGLMHTCKRILQVWYDAAISVSAATGALAIGSTAAVAATGGTAAVPVALVNILMIILRFVMDFIIGRLMRLLVDTVEFNTIKNDAKSIVEDLRSKAKSTNDEKIKEKMNNEADRLEKAIQKYS